MGLVNDVLLQSSLCYHIVYIEPSPHSEQAIYITGQLRITHMCKPMLRLLIIFLCLPIQSAIVRLIINLTNTITKCRCLCSLWSSHLIPTYDPKSNAGCITVHTKVIMAFPSIFENFAHMHQSTKNISPFLSAVWEGLLKMGLTCQPCMNVL